MSTRELMLLTEGRVELLARIPRSSSLQWFVDCDFGEHYFTLHADAPETHGVLSQIALFDVVANNTDRKSGHVLRGHDGHI